MKLKSYKAAGLIEYTVLTGFISVAAIGTVLHFSQNTQKTFSTAQVTLAAHSAYLGQSSPEESSPEESLPEATLIYNTTNSPKLNENAEDFSVDFWFPETQIGLSDSRTRIKSSYEDLPFPRENYGVWYNFSVWSNDDIGNPTAVRHIETGQNTNEGRVQYGTMLEIDIPEIGETRTTFINVGGTVGGWTITRDAYPAVEPFGFPDTFVAWDDVHTRISSDYLDIIGLTTRPLPFTVTSNDGTGNPVATHHVEGGGSANSGELTNGTILEVDIPSPGKTRILTLTVDGVQGTWRVEREAEPSTPPLSLSSNNGHNFAQIRYSSNGAEDLARPFTITGTGNTNPYLQNISSGTGTSGMTATWGSNIRINVPPSSNDVETITLTIDGQVITWTVTGY